jgi:hypothetical protein
MNESLKLVFLVISANNGIYAQLQKCWRSWAAQNNADTLTFLVQGDPRATETCLSDDMVISAPRGESLVPGVLEKTVDAMQFILKNHDFDYLVRTNLSSFWMNEYCLQNYFSERLGRDGCYAGYAGIHQGQLFVSGAGIIMSPDVAENIVRHSHLLQKDLADDVAIGRLVQQHKLAPLIPLQNSRYDIIEHESLPDDHAICAHLETICRNRNITHVRLKNPDRNTDIVIFQRLLDLQRSCLSGKAGHTGHPI